MLWLARNAGNCLSPLYFYPFSSVSSVSHLPFPLPIFRHLLFSLRRYFFKSNHKKGNILQFCRDSFFLLPKHIPNRRRKDEYDSCKGIHHALKVESMEMQNHC